MMNENQQSGLFVRVPLDWVREEGERREDWIRAAGDWQEINASKESPYGSAAEGKKLGVGKGAKFVIPIF